MRASTHERTIQADADEPANPIGTDLPSLSPFVAVRASVLPHAPTPKLLQPAHRDALKVECSVYAKLSSRLGGRAPTTRFGNPSI